MTNKGYGVQVTTPGALGADALITPLVVVARDERDAELVAAAAAGRGADAETLRELSGEEIDSYGLDLDVHGDAKTLPILNL